MRKGPISKGPRTIKEVMRITINQNRDASHRDTNKHPFPPFRTKAKMPHEIEEELPIDMVIGFLQVQLANNARNTQFQPASKTLIGYKN
jgi:hypothetical protein